MVMFLTNSFLNLTVWTPEMALTTVDFPWATCPIVPMLMVAWREMTEGESGLRAEVSEERREEERHGRVQKLVAFDHLARLIEIVKMWIDILRFYGPATDLWEGNQPCMTRPSFFLLAPSCSLLLLLHRLNWTAEATWVKWKMRPFHRRSHLFRWLPRHW